MGYYSIGVIKKRIEGREIVYRRGRMEGIGECDERVCQSEEGA